MRRTFAWIVMVTLVAVLPAPALAQQAPAPAAPAPKTAPAKTAPAKMEAKAKTKSATGTVKSAAAERLVLLVGKDKTEMTFAVDDKTKITKAGKAAKATDIAAADSATVTYSEAEGKMVAQKVTVKARKAAAAKPKS